MKMFSLLPGALLLMAVVSGIPAARSCKAGAQSNGHNRCRLWTGPDKTPFSVLVTDSVTHTPDKTYSTYVVYRGILLGGLRRLQNSTKDFTFTYTEDPNYGPFLESVSGLFGSKEKRTYWQLLVNTTKNPIIIPQVGIGCYIPMANDQIILEYTKY